MSYRRVIFEGEVEVEGLPEGMRDDVDETEVKQAVQNELGHTGVIVTEIIDWYASS